MFRFTRISALFALCLASIVWSQEPYPSKPLTRRDSETYNQQQRALRHININLQVSDKSSKPIPDLTQHEVTLLDNGIPRNITDFSFVDGAFAQPSDIALLVFDTNNIDVSDMAILRQGLEKYLRQSGKFLYIRISIVVLGDDGAIIGEPSRDTKILLGEVQKLSPTVRPFDSVADNDEAVELAKKSVRGLTEIAKYEVDKPGHKLLLWLGPGWPLLDNLRAPTPLNRSRYFNSIVDINTKLRQASITLYSIIPRNPQRADTLHQFAYLDHLKGVQAADDADAPSLALQVLSTQSGGRVLMDNGDIASKITRCIDDSRAYYRLSFDAQPASNPNEYHEIEIQLARPNLTPRTVNFFYAQPDPTR